MKKEAVLNSIKPNPEESNGMLLRIIGRLCRDNRLSPRHIDLMMALIHLNGAEKNSFSTCRRLVMAKSHIKSNVTYHRTIRELESWDYLCYKPNYHPAYGSEITINYAQDTVTQD